MGFFLFICLLFFLFFLSEEKELYIAQDTGLDSVWVFIYLFVCLFGSGGRDWDGSRGAFK